MGTFYEEFGEKLKGARKAAGLTQGAVGERVGLTRTSVTNIERGAQRIPLHQLFKLASAVGVAPAELLPEQEVPLEELVSTKDFRKMPKNEEDRREIARLLIDVAPMERGGPGRRQG